MKRQTRWWMLLFSLVLITGLLLTGCESGEKTKEDQPLLFWEVTDGDGEEKLYLMGSIHIGTEEMYPMADPIEQGFAASDALAVELDLLAYESDYATQLALSYAYGVYQDGTTAKDHMSKETYEAAKEVLTEYGLYQPACELLKVSQWSSLLQQAAITEAGFDSAYGVDRYFLRKAKEQEMPIYEVESVEFQLEMMDGFSDDLQEYIVKSNLDIPALAEAQRAMYAAWQQGDAELLAQTDIETDSDEEEQLVEEYLDKLIYSRNDTMAKKAETYLKSGETVFLTVGAGHMGGETGIVTQLKKKGYTVKQFTASGAVIEPEETGEISSRAA